MGQGVPFLLRRQVYTMIGFIVVLAVKARRFGLQASLNVLQLFGQCPGGAGAKLFISPVRLASDQAGNIPVPLLVLEQFRGFLSSYHPGMVLIDGYDQVHPVEAPSLPVAHEAELFPRRISPVTVDMGSNRRASGTRCEFLEVFPAESLRPSCKCHGDPS